VTSIHRPLVQVHDGPTPPARNGLTAEDAALVALGRACVLCGRPRAPLDQRLVYLDGLTVYATRCFPCRDVDPGCERLHAFLTERYRPERTWA
jgi:hypothetical protein